MAMEIGYLTLSGGFVHSKGGKTSGERPAAMAYTNLTYHDVTEGGVAGLSKVGAQLDVKILNAVTKLGANATVTNGVVKFGVKNKVDVKLDSMQSLLERMDRDSTDIRKMLVSLRRQKALGPS